MNYSIIDKAVCKTSLATQGRLKKFNAAPEAAHRIYIKLLDFADFAVQAAL